MSNPVAIEECFTLTNCDPLLVTIVSGRPNFANSSSIMQQEEVEGMRVAAS